MKTLIYSMFAVSLFSLMGCGGSESEEFVGLWDVTGSTSINMPMKGQLIMPVNEQITIHEGVDSNIVLTSAGCTMPASVKNGIATVTVNHTCTTRTPEGAALNLTFTKGIVTINRDTFSLNASGTVTYVNNGRTMQGEFLMTQTATRLAK